MISNECVVIEFQRKINIARLGNDSVVATMVILAAVLLVGCGCTANAEPTSPAQVAAAVAAATGTGENHAQPSVEPVTPSSSVSSEDADSVNRSTAAAKLEPQLSAVTVAAATEDDDDDNHKVRHHDSGEKNNNN